MRTGFRTFPEVLQAAGVSWKIYQDLAGQTFSPDFGDGTGNSFAGNFTDNSVLYFNQYATAAPGTPLFDKACTGTEIINIIPSRSGAPEHVDGLGRAPVRRVPKRREGQQSCRRFPGSWAQPVIPSTRIGQLDYGAWYISQIFGILVSNPEVFSKTVFIVNYDEADGSFDHLVPPCCAAGTPAYGPPPSASKMRSSRRRGEPRPSTAQSAPARVCRLL